MPRSKETEDPLADIADEGARLETRLADLKAQEGLAICNPQQVKVSHMEG